MTASSDPSALPDDDALFAELADAVRGIGGPTTEHERELARPARDRLAETDPFDLAELVFDSVLDDAVLVRSTVVAEARRISFDAPDVTIQVELASELLTCHLDPPLDGTVVLVTLGDERHAFTDLGGGRYELADPPAGMVQLEVDADGTRVVTSWFRI